jgi:hypothetical protein
MNSIVQFFKNLQENNTLTPCWMLKVQNDAYKDIIYSIVKDMLFSKSFQNHGMSDAFVTKQIDQNAYPNFLYVTRSTLEDDTLSTEIKIEDAKKINAFLQKKPAIDGWRVVLIDSIDDMNHFAANSLLKVMEEPPKKTLILLVVKQIGLILPTIRSRCKVVTLGNDDNQDGNLLFPTLEKTVSDFLHNKSPNFESFFKGISEKNKDLTVYKKEMLNIIYKKIISPEQVLKEHVYTPAHWVNVFEALNVFFNATHQAHLDNMHVLNMSLAALKNPDILLETTIHDL